MGEPWQQGASTWDSGEQHYQLNTWKKVELSEAETTNKIGANPLGEREWDSKQTGVCTVMKVIFLSR